MAQSIGVCILSGLSLWYIIKLALRPIKKARSSNSSCTACGCDKLIKKKS